MKKPAKTKNHVKLTAVWGSDDADSTIKVSPRRWKAIQEGAEYGTVAVSWYEGEKYRVTWHFSNGMVSIEGEDGMQCVDCSIEDLIVQTDNTDCALKRRVAADWQ